MKLYDFRLVLAVDNEPQSLWGAARDEYVDTEGNPQPDRAALLTIRTLAGNSGSIYVGGYTVSSTTNLQTGLDMAADEELKLPLVSLKSVYVVGTKGDIVQGVYLAAESSDSPEMVAAVAGTV